MTGHKQPDRRQFLGMLGASAALTTLPVGRLNAADETTKMPPVGLGSWITFNVGNDPQGLASSTQVIGAFLEAGGRLIDSSPMYGSSQATIGHALSRLERAPRPFAADKVWIRSGRRGPEQIEESRRLWGVDRFDLLQVHNLMNWEEHLETLRVMKADGSLQHVGVTTSHGRRHGELEHIMTTQEIDFVQMTYNLRNREAEARLLPLALERGINVIINRPYDGGSLIRRLKRNPLPDWAIGLGLESWADVALGFIISHPAVTVAIPATTRVDHVRENVTAAKQSGLPGDTRLEILRRVRDI